MSEHTENGTSCIVVPDDVTLMCGLGHHAECGQVGPPGCLCSCHRQQRLTIRPTTLRAANRFVGEEHRHHPPTRGHKFSIAVHDEADELRGVAIAGRPVARHMDDGRRLEALRVATDGCENACSALYGAVARAGVGMGYERHDIFTYTLFSEPGTSLRAAGWVPVRITDEDDWDRPSRRRNADHHPTERKVRWHAACPPDMKPLDLDALRDAFASGSSGEVDQ